MKEFDENGYPSSDGGDENTDGASGTNENDIPEGGQDSEDSSQPGSEGENGGATPPPDFGRRPDYSYSWNGAEHGNKKRGKGFRGFIIAAVVCILVVASLVAVTLASSYGAFDSSSSSDLSSAVSGTVSGTSDTSKEAVSVPEVITADTTSKEYTSELTKIYEESSKSCCTVTVTYKNTSGYALGSGFVINADEGYIATNHHVIEDANKVKVTFYDGTEYDAEIVGSDSTSDLAVLKVSATGLTQISLGSSDTVSVGEAVVAIGTPYSEELAGTMSYGIISGIARDIEITNDYGTVVKTMTLLQTDCSINPGNSGGPLINMAGQVVGITSLKIVDEEFENIGFAIPITSAIKIFNQLIAGEDVDSDFTTASAKIGVTVYDLEKGLAAYRITPKCEYPSGVLVVSIDADSSAYAAGLETFDIITEFNGDTIGSLTDLTTALKKYSAGDTVTMKVFRFNRNFSSGTEYSITFKLDAAS